MDARRGYVPEDDRNFSPDSIKTMRVASRHIAYLINEGYDLKQASTFVGNHLLLSGRPKALIAEVGENYIFDLDIRIQSDVDRELYGKKHVITSDSIILDHCVSRVDLLSA